MSGSLFPADDGSTGQPGSQPLADRMRPRILEEVVGQSRLLGEGRFLTEVVRSGQLPSMILWGPPGVGKTTLAQILARESKAHFVSISAVLAGVKDVKNVIEEARFELRRAGRRTVLFVDEIHRFNKAQQDAFLPHVEDGTLILIGATTENPSFEVIAPLLSRTRVVVLEPLSDGEVLEILTRALNETERGLEPPVPRIASSTCEKLAAFANGDARRALNALEVAAQLARQVAPQAPAITDEILREALQHRGLLYDKTGEEHFNLISALHKSLRNSDPDAALYWLARMLEAGEDPLYVARRMVRFASEDIGLADPRALSVALDARDAYVFIGLPEGKLALAQAAVYLALAPKSNALYRAYGSVSERLESGRNEPVPLHLRNAPTRLMKDLGYGAGYRYAHDEPNAVSEMDCLPDSLRGTRFYDPSEQGVERALAERLRALRARRK
jgi:putative ATPase